jgi:hypothetical protein
MYKWLVFFGFWLGCGGSPIIPPSADLDSGNAEEEDEGWGSSTSPDADADADADADDGGDEPAPLENPTINLASAVCLSEDGTFWRLKLIASDPQGLDTLSGEAKCDIYPVGATEGSPTHSVSMECGLGDCGQNYEGLDEGVLCANASDWEFHFTIMDEEGYVSATEVVVGSVE